MRNSMRGPFKRPKISYSLSAGLRQTDIGYEQFKRLLKTYLYGRWDRGACDCL